VATGEQHDRDKDEGCNSKEEDIRLGRDEAVVVVVVEAPWGRRTLCMIYWIRTASKGEQRRLSRDKVTKKGLNSWYIYRRKAHDVISVCLRRTEMGSKSIVRRKHRTRGEASNLSQFK